MRFAIANVAIMAVVFARQSVTVGCDGRVWASAVKCPGLVNIAVSNLWDNGSMACEDEQFQELLRETNLVRGDRTGDLQGCFGGNAEMQAFCCIDDSGCWDAWHRPQRCCDHGKDLPAATEKLTPPTLSPDDVKALSCALRARDPANPGWWDCVKMISEWAETHDFREIKDAGEYVYFYAKRDEHWKRQFFAAELYVKAAERAKCDQKAAWQKELPWPKDAGLTFERHFPLCTETWFAEAVHCLKRAGFWSEAFRLYQHVLKWDTVRWTNFNETPVIAFIPQLESKPWWTDDYRVATAIRVIRGIQPVAAAELVSLLATEGIPLNDAYVAFKTNFTWSSVVMYDCFDGWRSKGCDLFPRTCALLRSSVSHYQITLPSPTYCLTNHQERISILRMEPGTGIPLHAGLTTMINIHIGLLGVEGAELNVAGEVHRWSVEKAFAFQDSFDHHVHHHGLEPRFVLMMTVAHPEWVDYFRNREIGVDRWKSS